MEHVSNVMPSLFQDDKEMKAIMEYHIDKEVYTHGSLSITTRELLTLAILAANNGGTLIKDVIYNLHKQGVCADIIKESVYQAIPYAGVIVIHTALQYVNEAFQELHMKSEKSYGTVTETTRFQKGFALQCALFSKEVIQDGYDRAPQDEKHIQQSLSNHCFGDFYTRQGLDIQQRELLTFCVIASLGGCEYQLIAHAKANLVAGNTRDTLLEAITQCQPYIGYPRTLNAQRIIDEVVMAK